jgi:hypothetical protein
VLLANAVSTTPREGLRSNVVARPRAPSADHTQAARGSEPAAAEPASLETASDIEAPAVVEVPAAGARAAAPAPVVTSEAREPAVHTAAVDTREPSPQPLLATDAPIGGTAPPLDGGLANVSRPSLSSTSSERMMGVESTAVGGLRERTRAAATEASDHRVLTHGIRAEIDLGDGGHITVHAENPASRVEVKLDTDVGATARTLAQHARELAGELRTDGRDARVTVSGPGTHTTVTSSGSSAGDAGGYEASSRRESDAREPRDGRQQDEAGAERGAANGPPARVSRRARFVL